MSIIKPFAASTLAIILAASAYAADVRYGDSALLFGFTESYSIKNTVTNVTITGKVKTPDGRPIRAALITLKDADTNALVRSTYSSNFGYYRLEQVETGRLYVLSVAHKRYLFALPAQLLEINEDRAGVDFTGEASDQA
jgi:hypothetical protein